MNAHTAGALGATGVALAHGVGLAIIVSMTMNISGGHINPAVTAALWLADKVNGRTALSYVVAQLVGALVGAALMKGLLPVAAVRVTLAGAPKLADTVTFMQGIWIEAVLTWGRSRRLMADCAVGCRPSAVTAAAGRLERSR